MAETLVFRGASGVPYLFYVYQWNQPFSSLGAVYAVLRKEGIGYTVAYLGQTGDLSCRFDDHHKQDCFDRAGMTHIAVHPVPGESRRLMIETDLVRAYTPACNG